MQYILRHITILTSILLLLLTSCSQDDSIENTPDAYNGKRLSMNIQFAGSKVGATDSTIESVRIIVFNDKDQLVFNDVRTATFNSGVYNVETEAAPGFNNFYVICNETEELGKKLTAIKRESDIELTNFSGIDILPPIPMYGKVLRAFVTANSDGSNAKVSTDYITTTDYLPVKVDRMLARINFTAIKNVTTPEEDFEVKELRIRVCRLPKSMTIGESDYIADVWSVSSSIIGTGQLNNNGVYTVNNGVYTIPDDLNRITFPDIYIPEHLMATPADRSRATYLAIDATCQMKNGSTQLLHSTYQLCIGKEPPISFELERNNTYQIYATITGIGAMGIYAEIKAMEQYDIPVNWKPIDGLVIVSDKISDYDLLTDESKNVNIWSDYTVYSGILKTYHSDKGYNDIVFKYGSLIGVRSDRKSTTTVPFVPPLAEDNLGDILWFPSSYGNPYIKNILDWDGIPYVASGNIPVDNKRISEGLGDPCKLVGLTPDQIGHENITDNKQWHMATPAEYAILMQAADKEVNDNGYKSFHYILAPNVTERDASGVLSTQDSSGLYWTIESASAFGFSSTLPANASVAAQAPQKGLTIRCVRNEIPASMLSVNYSPSFGYQGNTTTGSSFNVTTNIPYWTATLIEDSGDSEIGSSREFQDFSFAPGDTNVKYISGGFNEVVRVYMKRKESRLSRTFRIRITGMGFDGNTETVHQTVSQSGYTLRGTPSFTPEINTTDKRIPKDGATYAVSVSITPTDISVPNGQLYISASYHGSVIGTSNSISTVSSQYIYDGFNITIPKNETPDTIGIEFTVYLINSTEYGAKTTIGGVYYLQSNK